MTDDHLPECLMWDVRVCMCICLELRDCEERMLTTYLARNNFDAGLDAAREAVLGAKAIDVAYGRGLDEPAQFIWLNNALSAIDALREDSDD